MADLSKSELQTKLKVLQQNFKLQLDEKTADIEHLWALIRQQSKPESLQNLHRMVHSLAGSGGTYGAMAVSKQARMLEQMLLSLLTDLQAQTSNSVPATVQLQISQLVNELKDIANAWQPSDIPYIPPDETVNQADNSLIYLIEDDPVLGRELTIDIESYGFQVVHFTQLIDFERAVKEQMPAVILMDIVLQEGDIAGAEAISSLKQSYTVIPPVIFMSVRDDIIARLAAARAGANRYFAKPLDMEKLSQTLAGLTLRSKMHPFRILAIDDDQALLDYYETVLSNAGMEVRTLTDPLQTLNALNEFKPDVILVDVYMPNCSGPELAEVIRQDDGWSLTPIIFLSTESNLSRQLSAMNQGGDDFLVKPIQASHLEAAVAARAKRSRWTTRLRDDLQRTKRDNEFQLVTMNKHAIVCITNPQGEIIYINDKFCAVSGYRREELLGQTNRIINSGKQPDTFFEQMWGTITQGKIWQGIICNLSKNAEKYWVDATIVPFVDEAGTPYKYVTVQTDITSYRESENKYRSLFELSDDANVVLDKNGLIDCNQSTISMFGCTQREKFLSMGLNDVFPPYAVDDMHVETIDEKMQQAYENGHLFFEWALKNINGDKFQAEITLTPMVVNGRYLLQAIIRDVTDEKQTREEIVAAREAADHANHAKSKFLASMSHELRTPMNAIIGFSQLLQMDSSLDDSQLDSVNEIIKAGEHLLKLINEVLDLSKIEAGHIDLSIDSVDLKEVVAESLYLIEAMAVKRDISIELIRNGEVIKQDNMPDKCLMVRADYTRLKQVLLNLLSNAVKYNSDHGKLTISCDLLTNNNVRISVSDTGNGLTEEQQNLLFKPFERLGMEVSNIDGTGIGLVISSNIVQLMGSTIEVESEPGKGSTFWFELEGDVMNKLIEEDAENKLSLSTDAASKQSDEQQYEHSVLYIEDNPANMRLVSQLLARHPSLYLWTAPEPLLGLELALAHLPDLILLDINLPGMNGFEVLKRLRDYEVTKNISVIAVSANAMERDIAKALEAGFDGYITKPINVVDFLQTIDKALLKNNDK